MSNSSFAMCFLGSVTAKVWIPEVQLLAGHLAKHLGAEAQKETASPAEAQLGCSESTAWII